MKSRRDIQELIPDTYRDLIEAVPRGFARSAVTGAVLFGALVGASLTFAIPEWLAAAILASLLAAHLLFIRRSDKLFDKRMADLRARDLDWETTGDS